MALLLLRLDRRRPLPATVNSSLHLLRRRRHHHHRAEEALRLQALLLHRVLHRRRRLLLHHHLPRAARHRVRRLHRLLSHRRLHRRRVLLLLLHRRLLPQLLHLHRLLAAVRRVLRHHLIAALRRRHLKRLHRLLLPAEEARHQAAHLLHHQAHHLQVAVLLLLLVQALHLRLLVLQAAHLLHPVDSHRRQVEAIVHRLARLAEMAPLPAHRRSNRAQAVYHHLSAQSAMEFPEWTRQHSLRTIILRLSKASQARKIVRFRIRPMLSLQA